MKTKASRLIDMLRVWPWLLGAMITVALVFVLDPHRIGLLIWSLSKLSLGAYLGYWIDRSIFYSARPGDTKFQDANSALATMLTGCMIRRAIIIAASVLALGLGV